MEHQNFFNENNDLSSEFMTKKRIKISDQADST